MLYTTEGRAIFAFINLNLQGSRRVKFFIKQMYKTPIIRRILPRSLPTQFRAFTATPQLRITEKETIVKLLYNIGSRKEVEQYLQHFSSVEHSQFAIIKVFL
jgi:hypothetical protein